MALVVRDERSGPADRVSVISSSHDVDLVARLFPAGWILFRLSIWALVAIVVAPPLLLVVG